MWHSQECVAGLVHTVEKHTTWHLSHMWHTVHSTESREWLVEDFGPWSSNWRSRQAVGSSPLTQPGKTKHFRESVCRWSAPSAEEDPRIRDSRLDRRGRFFFFVDRRKKDILKKTQVAKKKKKKEEKTASKFGFKYSQFSWSFLTFWRVVSISWSERVFVFECKGLCVVDPREVEVRVRRSPAPARSRRTSERQPGCTWNTHTEKR